MEDYNLEEVRHCYELTAEEYSAQFSNELDGKPFDRSILSRFVMEFKRTDKFIDAATGTGHIANFLHLLGLEDITGIDISERSLEVAQKKYPNLKFENRNIFSTGYKNNSIDGIVCFYGIVHFAYKEIDLTIKEWKRILRPGGKALFSFHIGEDDSLRVEKYLDKEGAKATWNYFRVEEIIDILNDNEIEYDEVVIRYPYINKEYPSKRCYIQFSK